MGPESPSGSDDWLDRWLDGVQDGRATMSQRAITAIEKHGGIDAAVAAATARGVHLLRLQDDQGVELLAASRHPFTALC